MRLVGRVRRVRRGIGTGSWHRIEHIARPFYWSETGGTGGTSETGGRSETGETGGRSGTGETGETGETSGMG